MEDAINAKASRVEAYTEALEDLEWMEEESHLWREKNSRTGCTPLVVNITG